MGEVAVQHFAQPAAVATPAPPPVTQAATQLPVPLHLCLPGIGATCSLHACRSNSDCSHIAESEMQRECYVIGSQQTDWPSSTISYTRATYSLLLLVVLWDSNSQFGVSRGSIYI
eukprot:3602472-Amphidinium_carterae.1